MKYRLVEYDNGILRVECKRLWFWDELPWLIRDQRDAEERVANLTSNIKSITPL